MARLKTIKEDGKTTFALLIDHSVGVKGRNRRDDVQLIQFLCNSSGAKIGVSRICWTTAQTFGRLNV